MIFNDEFPYNKVNILLSSESIEKDFQNALRHLGIYLGHVELMLTDNTMYINKIRIDVFCKDYSDIGLRGYIGYTTKYDLEFTNNLINSILNNSKYLDSFKN